MHLKRLVAPAWPGLLRKVRTFVIAPAPGTHNSEISMPLGLWLRHMGLANTRREISHIVSKSTILVDGRRITDDKFVVGFMDILEIKEASVLKQVSFDNKGNLVLVDVKSKNKPSRIIGKTVVKGGKIQYNLFDGKNLLSDQKYNIGDTLVLEVPTQKVVSHLKLEKGANIILTRGKHKGQKGKVVRVDENKVTFDSNGEVETLKEYAFVIQ